MPSRIVLRSLAVPEALRTAWASWEHAAEFHHRTKDVVYEAGASADAEAGAPPPLRRPPDGQPPLHLPAVRPEEGRLTGCLVARRTWRQFGAAGVPLADVAILCQYTFGVQWWMYAGDADRQALKTSPSGGARHSVEAYVMALRVEDLESGVYHYDPDLHALRLLETGFDGESIRRSMPAQPCFWGAGAVLFLTSRFERVRARYPHSRAYRTILAEVGHLGQSFCLLATEMGLAPFTTMAIADSEVDRLIGVDGVSESVLYALGVGSRPEDGRPTVAKGRPSPRLAPPTYARRED